MNMIQKAIQLENAAESKQGKLLGKIIVVAFGALFAVLLTLILGSIRDGNEANAAAAQRAQRAADSAIAVNQSQEVRMATFAAQQQTISDTLRTAIDTQRTLVQQVTHIADKQDAEKRR